MLRVLAKLGFALAALSALAAAQVGVLPFRSPHATFFDQNGNPLAGGCVFTYEGGTTTAEATYTDFTGTTQNSNPVILDSTGSANIWLGPSTYKFAVWTTGGTNCATGTLQYTVDQVPGDTYLNPTISGATMINTYLYGGVAINGATENNAAITLSTVDSTPIGQTTPAVATFTSDGTALNQMTFSSTPVFNATSYGGFYLTLTNNVTTSTLTGGQTGETANFLICQNSTGGYTFTWPGNLLLAPSVDLQPNACTYVQLYDNGGTWYPVVTSTPSTGMVVGVNLVGAYDTLTFSSTPAYNASAYTHFAMTLTGSVGGGTLTGGIQGQLITISLCQNGTGGASVAWPANLANPPVVATAANACTSLVAVCTTPGQWSTVGVNGASSTGAAFSQVLVPSPAAPASTSSFTMQGMAGAITPNSTGRVDVSYAATLSSCGSTAGDGIYFQFYYGTGTAPVNGAATTGTNVTVSANAVQVQYVTAGANLGAVPISASFAVTGLTVGTAYWFDVAAKAATATGCAASSPVLKLREF